MSEKFTVEIISPDKSIIKSDTTEVTIPSFEGEMGILNCLLYTSPSPRDDR